MSHGRILRFLQEHPEIDALCRVYSKQQLVNLCEAYNVKVERKWNKKTLATQMSVAAKQNTSIPLTVPVDDRQFRVARIAGDETQGSVRMMLRRN